jgi:hypothetical protein
MSLPDRLRPTRPPSRGLIAMTPPAISSPRAVRMASRYSVAHGQGPRLEPARTVL